MERKELEQKVLEGLNIQRPCDTPIYKKAITLKSTPELERILESMKAADQ